MLVHGYSITVYRSESGQTAACHDLAPPPGVAGLGAHACSDSPPLCSDSFKIYCSSVVLGVLRLEVARTLVRAGLDRPSPRRGGCDEAVARGAAQQRGGKHSAQHRGLSPPLVGARVRCLAALRPLLWVAHVRCRLLSTRGAGGCRGLAQVRTVMLGKALHAGTVILALSRRLASSLDLVQLFDYCLDLASLVAAGPAVQRQVGTCTCTACVHMRELLGTYTRKFAPFLEVLN